MTEEDNLKKKVNELQNHLKDKDEEISNLEDKVEQLEDEIMRYEEVVDEKTSKKKSKKAKQSIYEIELEAKDREIRELKNRMGYLRKEKIDVQKELEEIKQDKASSSIIRVEELREKPPLNTLLQELQDKIKRQESIIRRLNHQNSDTNEFETQLREKDELIVTLQKELDQAKETGETVPLARTEENSFSGSIKEEILSDLQDKLNKTKFRNEELRKKLEKYENKDKNGSFTEITELKAKISDLTTQLNNKTAQIEGLEEKSVLNNISGDGNVNEIIKELQNKLNKARTQNTTLQDQLKAVTSQPSVENSDDTSNLKIQREMASFLQKQLNDSNKALNIKEEEIATIKSEAIRIKRKYEDLENLIKQKDMSMNNLQTELESYKIQKKFPTSSKPAIVPEIDLKIKELESLVEDLTKQNIQQRIEISELRKK